MAGARKIDVFLEKVFDAVCSESVAAVLARVALHHAPHPAAWRSYAATVTT
jgi:hypothetical protein